MTVLAAAVGLVVAGALPAPAATPNDPLYAETDEILGQWNLRQINAADAWDVARNDGAGAVIAVIDSGVDLGHPDLAANIVEGGGVTFAGCKQGPRPCGNGAWTDVPHGTHVAGIAAAATGNGIGIAGVAPQAKILPIRVEGVDEIAGAIRYAADNGAHVINMSLGIGAAVGPVPVPGSGLLIDSLGDEELAAVTDAIGHALLKGVVVVVAAGNEAFPLCDYPSSVDGVVCVAATDWMGKPAEYSDLPNKSDQLALRAPGGGTDGVIACGGGVISTVPAGTAVCELDGGAGEYEEYVGTSMAAPHVAGVAALLVADGCTGIEATELLVDTANNPITPDGYDPVWGWGLLDAKAALSAAQAVCTP